jgi:hypothetical protein
MPRVKIRDSTRLPACDCPLLTGMLSEGLKSRKDDLGCLNKVGR